MTDSSKLNLQKLTRISVTVVLLVCSFIFAENATALMLELQESEKPPASIEKPPVEELEQVAPAVSSPEAVPASTDSSQPASSPQSSTPTSTPQQSAEKPERNLPGIFKLWTPVDKFLPLKSATVDIMAVSFANDEQWSRALSSHNNKFGNYFIEAGRSFGEIKDFNLKLQSSKQLKNQYAKNDFMELRANVFGINTVYSRKSSQTASAASSNSTVDKTLGLNYRFDNGLSLGFNTKQTRTANLTTAAPTINRQLGYNIRWDRKKYRLNFTNTATTNYNQSSGAVSKNTQSSLIVGVPINDLLEVNLRLQSNGTNNSAPGSASTSDDKFTKALGLSYRPNSKMAFIFNRTLTDNESVTPTAISDYGIVSNEYVMNYAISRRLNFQAKSVISNNESTGKTTDHSNSLSFDHKSFKLLPAATTFSLVRKSSNAAGNSQKTKTFTASMPLSYMQGKLGINLSRTKNEQLSISAGAESENDSLTNKVASTYRITPSLSLNSSVSKVKNSGLSGATVSEAVNRTFDDNVTYTIKNPLTENIGPLKRLDYKVGKTSIRNETVLPNPTMTANDSTKQSGNLAFQASSWNGTYSYSWGHARQDFGMSAKVRQHKVTWNFNDLFGYRVSANFSSGRQVVGLASNGIFRAERSLNDKSNMFINYEFSKNQDSTNAANNKFMKYFEAGLQVRF